MALATGSGSLESLRERNRRQLLDTLRRKGSASRAELARLTSLSRSTVSTLVADLQASGLVVEQEHGRTTDTRGSQPRRRSDARRGDGARRGGRLRRPPRDRAGRVLGRSIAALVNAFNPELVVVGGAVSVAGDVLLDPPREQSTATPSHRRRRTSASRAACWARGPRFSARWSSPRGNQTSPLE